MSRGIEGPVVLATVVFGVTTIVVLLVNAALSFHESGADARTMIRLQAVFLMVLGVLLAVQIERALA